MVCAYCNKEGKLTKEHIWPAAIVNELDDRLRYSEKAGKLFYADLVIRDVCERCNNGPLSTLDQYGMHLYKSYFSVINHEYFPIRFEYNYSQLARWLLKLSFNSARASESDSRRLEKYKECIIDQSVSLPNDFSIYLDIVEPYDDGEKFISSSSNRICRVKFPDDIGDWCTVRMVSINSFYFWIVIQDKEVLPIDYEKFLEVRDSIPGLLVCRFEDVIEVKPSGLDAVDAHLSWMPALMAAGPPPKRR